MASTASLELDDEEAIPQSKPTDEVDLSDETQDFRLLTSLTSTSTLPKRGEKDFEPHSTQKQASALQASQDAMHEALSHTRVHAPKSHLRGLWDAELEMVRMESQRGGWATTMGIVQGRKGGTAESVFYLRAEEALYLVERGSLDLRIGDFDGVSLSLQAAYALLIGVDGLTLEEYLVYSRLKRDGFTILRAPGFDGRDEDVPARRRTPQTWIEVLATIFERVTAAKEDLDASVLVKPGIYSSYRFIYKHLSLVPCHDPTAVTEREKAASNSDLPLPSPKTPGKLHISFHVWKPTTAFKKSAPPAPDFRIAILSARDTSFPDLEQLSDLLEQTPYDPPPIPKDGITSGNPGQLYSRIKHGFRNVILGVVDAGVVSFLTMSDAGFGQYKVYNRAAGRGGKRSGGRGGRGRGGGVSRGRGG